VPTASQEKTSVSEVNVSVSEKRSAASEEKHVCPLLPKKSTSASEVNVSVSKKRSAASEEKLFPLDTSVSNNEDEVSPVFPLGIFKHRSVDSGKFNAWCLAMKCCMYSSFQKLEI